MKTWFITGGTPGGFGMAYADEALHRGDQVVLTARRPDQLSDWAAVHGKSALVVPLDVTDSDQITAAVARAEDRFGSIDVLVNNAGRGWYGSIEGMPEEAVRRTFELNFFSVLAVTRAVLPGMRARTSGWIITMSSVAGLTAAGGFGFYTAAKHAIEGLTRALRDEVAPFGIKVLAVEPGAFRTAAYAGFATEPINDLTPYHPMLEQVRASMVAQHGHQPGDPARAVRAVLDAMDRPHPPEHLVLGALGYEAVTRRLESLLSQLHADETTSRGADFPC